MDSKSNKPAAPNAGIASRLAIGHHWPGVGEPERSAAPRAVMIGAANSQNKEASNL